MKRTITVILVMALLATLAFGLVGCGSQQAAPDNAKKVLKVGLNAEFPPFEAKTADGKYEGFDIDLVNALAKQMGYDEVKITDMSFDGLILSLQNGEFDMIVSAMTIKPDRAKKIDFSDPYYNANQAIAVLKDNTTIKGVNDLNNMVVTGQKGTTGILAVQDLIDKGTLKNVTIRDYPSISQCFSDLKTGAAKALVTDKPVVYNYVAKNPNQFKVIEDPSFAKEEYGIGIKKGNKDLLDKANAALKTLKSNGEYDKIYNKWIKAK